MFLPLKDNLKSTTFPVVTTILMVINIAVYYLATSDPISSYTGAILFGLIPYEITHAGIQCVPVHSVTNMVCGTPDQIHAIYPMLSLPPTMLTVVSSMFLHGGLEHLLGNMLVLFVFGRAVETALGRWSFLMIYLIAGVGADLGQTLWDTSSKIPVVGASGAIAGVMASYLVLFPGARIFSLFIIIPCRPRAGWVVGTWIALQMYMAWQIAGSYAQGGIAVFEHLGGFAAGAAMTYYAVDKAQIAEFREMARAFSSGAPIDRPRRERIPPPPRPEVAHAMAAGDPTQPAAQQYVAPPQQYVAPPQPPAT